jgi:hypothetical protein
MEWREWLIINLGNFKSSQLRWRTRRKHLNTEDT